ncbi:MAG: hypothetical protein LBC53_04105 [Spirochaetaceae bacterium]|jgi:hypothetical protein|nr:hypothetical protein [Spirochaetaceae bacterium]
MEVYDEESMYCWTGFVFAFFPVIAQSGVCFDIGLGFGKTWTKIPEISGFRKLNQVPSLGSINFRLKNTKCQAF